MRHHSLCNYTRIVGLMIFGMALLLFDFLSKAYIYHVFSMSQHLGNLSFPVFQNFFGIDFNLSLATNRGAAWGILSNFQIVLVCLRICAILGMFLYLFFFNRSQWVEFPLILIISGALGNVVDFFLYDYVIDFLHFNLWGYHFPVFNLADTFISVGVLWLLVASAIYTRSNSRIAFEKREKSCD